MLEDGEDWTLLLKLEKDRTSVFFDVMKAYSSGKMPFLDNKMGYARIGDIYMPLQDYYNLQENFVSGYITVGELRRILDEYKNPQKSLDDFMDDFKKDCF